METSPCVGSGFCCQTAPCPFGQVTSPTNLACKFLEEIKEPHINKRYTCGIADQIIGKPGAELCPAFGAGCCMPLFNPNRRAIIQELKEHPTPLIALGFHKRK